MDLQSLYSLILAVDAALILLSFILVVRAHRYERDTGINDTMERFRSPLLAQVIVCVGGLFLTYAGTVPLAQLVQRGKADLETIIACALVAVVPPFGVLLAAINDTRSYVMVGGGQLTVVRGRRCRIISLTDVVGIVSYKLSSGVRLRDGQLILLPGMIGLNAQFRQSLQRHL